MSYTPAPIIKQLKGVTSANSATKIPPNYFVQSVVVNNTTANAITGGLKFGTSSGGTQLLTALAVGANAVLPATGLNSVISGSEQTIFMDAVVAWNSASVDVTFIMMPF